MSESQINAYFIDDDLIKNSFSSKDNALVKQVFSDPNGLINNFSSGFSGKNLSDAIRDLIYGDEEDGYAFHYSFALWIVIDTIAKERPKEPHIPYPFLDLYEFNELLEENTSCLQLLEIFRSLNNEVDNKFPYQLNNWGDLPGFAYISNLDTRVLASEINRLVLAIEEEDEWTLDIEDSDDILHILSWLRQAATNEKNILLVLEGSL